MMMIMMIINSLKEKQAVESTHSIESPSQLGSLQGVLSCQVPNKELNVFQGVLAIVEDTIAPPPSSRSPSTTFMTTQSSEKGEEKNQVGLSEPFSCISSTQKVETAVDSRHLLLRGSILKNSNWVVGMVVYTGRLTKLSLNMNQPKFKFSGIETSLNEFVPKVLFLQLALSLVCV